MAHDVVAAPADGADLKPTSGPPVGGGAHRALRLRRLHALIGAVPLGGFVVYHIVDQHRAALQGPGPAGREAPATTTMVLGLTVLFAMTLHGVFGLHFTATGKAATPAWQRPVGWSRLLQAATGLAVGVFMVLHLWTIAGPTLVGSIAHGQQAQWLVALLSTSRSAIPTWGLVYLLALGAGTAHLSHGLWGSASAFGLARTPNAERAAAVVCAVLAVGLATVGGDVVVRLATGDGIEWPWGTAVKGSGEQLPGACEAPAADGAGGR